MRAWESQRSHGSPGCGLLTDIRLTNAYARSSPSS